MTMTDVANPSEHLVKKKRFAAHAWLNSKKKNVILAFELFRHPSDKIWLSRDENPDKSHEVVVGLFLEVYHNSISQINFKS